MDPFSFLFSIYNFSGPKCLGILRKISENIGISAPSDIDGVPDTDHRVLWDSIYEAENNDPKIVTLWSCFEKAADHKLTDEDFKAVLKIDGIASPKLSQGLFLIDPEFYLNLDSKTRRYLKGTYNLTLNYSGYTEYIELVSRIKQKQA